MKWLNLSSIKTKLRLAFLLVLGIVGFVILASLWSEHRNYQIDLSVSVITDISSEVKSLHIIQEDFFITERTNPKFYEKGSSKYLQTHQQNLKKVSTLIKEAQNQITHQKTLTSLSEISKITRQLEKDFDELVRLTLKLGFKNYGVIGKMREEAHNIEALPTLSDAQKVILLSIRRHEKDYLLGKEDKYQERLQSSIVQLERLLNQSPVTKAGLKALKEYQKYFENVVNLSKALNTKQDGIHAKLNQGQHKIEELSRQAINHLNHYAKKQKYQNYLILLSVLIIMFVFTVFIFYTVIRQLGKPISELSNDINKIIAEDFAPEITLEASPRKDEVGRISRDFQLMLSKVQENNSRIKAQKEVVEKAYKRIDLLSEIGKQITSLLSVESILASVYENLHQLMPADIIAVAVYEEADNKLIFYQEGVENPRYNSIPANDPNSLSSHTFTQRKPIYINDIQVEYKQYVDVILEIDDREPPRSRIYLPLIVKDRALGTISVQSFAANTYQAHHVDILENIANYTAIALDNARVYQKVDDQREELRASEEEIRQNMEEMLAINEKIALSEAELKGQISAINRTLGMIELDTNGTIIDANTIILHSLKYEREDLLGKSLRELMPEQILGQEAYRQFWQDLLQGIPQSGEFRLKSFYQQDVWLNATFTPILDSSLSTLKIIQLSSDITSQKEQSLEYQYQYEAINQFNALIEFNSDGHVINANQVFLDVMEYHLNEILGQPHSIFIPESQKDTFEYEKFLSGMLSGMLHEGEIKRVTKSGKTVWLSATYNPVYDLEGQLVKIVKFAQNITKRKRLEIQLQENLKYVQESEQTLRQNTEKLQETNEKLEESEQKFRQLIETNSVGIFIHDTQNNILYVNPECERIFGYSEEELLGLHLDDLLHNEFAGALAEQQAHFNNHQAEKRRYDSKFITKSGEERWLDLSYTDIEYGDGQSPTFLVSVFDITDKKEASEKLENASKIIEEKNQTLSSQKTEIEKRHQELEVVVKQVNQQKSIIEKKNEDITASITYAQRIQEAMLPRAQEIAAAFPNHFILFKPRDIVSGDFYWFCQKKYQTIIASVDCTGHGIPGAFMSLIGNDLLNEIVNIRNIIEPNKILDELKRGINQVLRQEETRNQDGMDIAVCTVDMFPPGYEDLLGTPKLRFSGANTPLIYMQDDEMHQIKGDKIIIGGFNPMERQTEFTMHTIDITKPTTFYIFSDGYQDQFGGEQKRKFMPRRLRNLLASIYDKPMYEQKQILDSTIEQWMAGQKQVDDMQVIGVRL